MRALEHHLAPRKLCCKTSALKGAKLKYSKIYGGSNPFNVDILRTSIPLECFNLKLSHYLCLQIGRRALAWEARCTTPHSTSAHLLVGCIKSQVSAECFTVGKRNCSLERRNSLHYLHDIYSRRSPLEIGYVHLWHERAREV